jgi:hypothetical protein
MENGMTQHLKIVPLFAPALTDTVEGLRRLADRIEAGEIDVPDGATVIAGDTVSHFGTINDTEAARRAVFHMTYGLHLLMTGALQPDTEN